MSVIQDNSITSNNIQPASGQALTIKDEGGTASITVQTDGDLTLAENAYLGSGKGIYFDGQTTSANFLDDYEEGTFTSSITSNNISATTGDTLEWRDLHYTKIGRLVHISGSVAFGQITSSTAETMAQLTLPFVSTSYDDFVGTVSILIGSGNDRFGLGVFVEGGGGTTEAQIYIAGNQINTTGSLGWLRFSATYVTS